MYIQPSDLDWVGGATDLAVVAKLIDKAEVRLAAMVAARGGDLAVLATNPVKLPLIKDVLENAVARVLRNPEGFRTESEGDYSYTLNALDASGNVWFPADEVSAIFGPSSGVRTLSVGLSALMRPSRSDWRTDDLSVQPWQRP